MMMMMGGVYEELRNGDDEQVCVLHPDPVVLEINRLENQLKGLILIMVYACMCICMFLFVELSVLSVIVVV